MVKEKISSKNKYLWQYLLSGLILVGTIFIGYLLIKQKTVIVAKKVELASLNRDLGQLDTILLEWKGNQEKINQAFRTLPTDYQGVSLAINEIEAIAQKTNQTLQTEIAEKPEIEAGNLPGLKITLKTDGSFGNLSQMISLLSNSVYHTKIESIQITKGEGKVINLINLRLYFDLLNTPLSGDESNKESNFPPIRRVLRQLAAQ